MLMGTDPFLDIVWGMDSHLDCIILNTVSSGDDGGDRLRALLYL